MSGGEVSGNTASSGSGAYSSYSRGGGVYVSSGTFTMSGSEISGNTASSPSGARGGGVYASITFDMSGGEVSNNILSGTNSYGREVLMIGGTFKMSGNARPQRVFLLRENYNYVTITGPLSAGPVPIDLGIPSSQTLTDWLGKTILILSGYYGNMADLKTHFTLGNTKQIDSPYTETPIPASYTIGDDGKLENNG
jgi:hypothetical protein